MKSLRGLRALAVTVLAALPACGPGAPAGPVEESLALAADTVITEWTELPSAVAVGRGRWAVIAADWDVAAIADLSANSMPPLGGAKQKAYLHPFHVFAFSDTVYLADWGKRRTTVWGGKLIDSIPFADGLRGAYVRARDAAGQLYFQVDPPPGRDGSGNRDSAAIVRAPRSLAKFDTVARLAPLEVAEMKRGGGEASTRFEQRVFSGNDLWGVWPDGTVWVARRFRNQIVSIDSRGRPVKGPELPDPVYEVTPADRDQYLQSYPPDLRPKETDVAWALIFPPFTAAFTAPDGTIWLEKSKPAIDSLRRIQVLDRGGNLRRVLVLHGQGRLIAVGAENLLVAEKFEKGVRLMEVRIPTS